MKPMDFPVCVDMDCSTWNILHGARSCAFGVQLSVFHVEHVSQWVI